MVEFLGTLAIGAFIGLFIGAMVQNRLDDKHVKNGIMEHEGVVYTVRPAKVVEQ